MPLNAQLDHIKISENIEDDASIFNSSCSSCRVQFLVTNSAENPHLKDVKLERKLKIPQIATYKINDLTIQGFKVSAILNEIIKAEN